jgi:hypothetical protein
MGLLGLYVKSLDAADIPGPVMTLLPACRSEWGAQCRDHHPLAPLAAVPMQPRSAAPVRPVHTFHANTRENPSIQSHLGCGFLNLASAPVSMGNSVTHPAWALGAGGGSSLVTVVTVGGGDEDEEGTGGGEGVPRAL